MKTTTLISGALVAVSHICSAIAITHTEAHKVSHVVRAGLQQPSQVPTLNAFRSQGCFKSKGNMTMEMNGLDVSSGSCNTKCAKDKYFVIALQGSMCYCGYAYPPLDDLAHDSDCSFACPAYGKEACGGLGQPGFYSIWNTGVNTADPTTGTSAATSQTQTPTETPPPEKDDGPSVAGIVAGTVAGVAVIAGIVGGCFFLVRRRRNAEIEEEHRRNAAVNAFINGSKPPLRTAASQ
ncbi:hypothetical protein PT974_03934 [Cladobotryum mycophilum]|uniref:WSC domain-containing protein n=1 Tax=Cladobotryum mycophilum TaxID=491253 RepID=A0ABR0SUU6_9HYPO